eukprot:TRINITY_DN6277_c0_g1_i6.p1 TRINITY_DN6277_c0_g1~~TRINITY_DN6277_c0_g1_i6.p1  ORF type:complete len:1084 (+),score=169.45 TRINITY_DN6277_c0_g1_i6:95-3346(+)
MSDEKGRAQILPDTLIRRGRISPSKAPTLTVGVPAHRRTRRPNTPKILLEPPVVDLSGANPFPHTIILNQRGIPTKMPDGDAATVLSRMSRPQSGSSTWARQTSASQSRRPSMMERRKSASALDQTLISFSSSMESIRPRSAGDVMGMSTTDSMDSIDGSKSFRRRQSKSELTSSPLLPKPLDSPIKSPMLPVLSESIVFSPPQRQSSIKDLNQFVRERESARKATPSTPELNSFGSHKDLMAFLNENKRKSMMIDPTATPSQMDTSISSVRQTSPTTTVRTSPTSRADVMSPELDRDQSRSVSPTEERKSYLQYVLYHTRPKYNIAVMASKKKFDKVVSAVISYPPCVSDKEEDGSTALHHASIFNEENVVVVLLKYDADPNVTESMRRTPLHWAANFGYTSIIQHLIRAGAKLGVSDLQGSTPLDLAERKKAFPYMSAWKKFKSAKTLDNMCALLFSDDKELTHLVIRELDDRSTQGDYCQKIFEQGHFARLTDLVRHTPQDYVCPGETPNRIHLGRAFARMCAHEGLRKKILDSGSLSFVIALARSKNLDDQYLAAHALRLVTESDDNLETFLREGGLIALITLADSKDERILQEAYQPILKLALDSENHEILIRKGGLRSIISMASSFNIELRRTSAQILANMSKNVQNHAKLTEEGAIEKIGPLLQEYSEIRDDAHSAFCHLSATREIHVQMIQHVGILRVVASANEWNIECMEKSVTSLLNFSENPLTHDDLMQKPVLDYLIKLYDLLDEDYHDSINRIFINTALQEKNRTLIAAHGVVPLVAIIKSTNYTNSPKLMAWAIQCLVEVASKGENERLEILERGGIPPLLHILAEAEVLPGLLTLVSCRCIAALTQSATVSSYLEKMQLLSYLVDLMKAYKEPRVVLSILNATECFLLTSEIATMDFVTLGGIPLVTAIDKAFRSDEKIQSSIDVIFDAVVKCDTNRPRVLECKNHRPYFAVLKVFQAVNEINWSIAALSLLAEISEKRSDILQADGLDLLIHALHSDKLSIDGRCALIRCLGTLGENGKLDCWIHLDLPCYVAGEIRMRRFQIRWNDSESFFFLTFFLLLPCLRRRFV